MAFTIPPPNAANQTTNNMFLDDLTDLLTKKIPKLSNTIIMGDFNINTEDISNADTVTFNDTMQTFGLNQHVNESMHQKGNILDLIFTEEKSDIQVAHCKTHIYISDHCMVTMDTNLRKQSWTRSTITIRDSSKLTIENLMANFTPPILEMDVILSQAYDQFNAELQKILDTVAPKKTIKQTDLPKNPWLNKYIRQQRKVVKNRDRVWRRYKQDHQWHTYKKRDRFSQSRSRTTKTIKKKGSFNLVSRIANSKAENPMLPDKSPEEVVGRVHNILLGKYGKNIPQVETIPAYQLKMTDTPLLTKFSPLTKDKIYKEIIDMKNMSCELNIICISLLQQLLSVCIDTIFQMSTYHLFQVISVYNGKQQYYDPH